MSTARVESIDALKDFRARVVKFAQTCRAALGDAESDASRLHAWLATEQKHHWESQARKRAEALSHAQEMLRHKRLFKNFDGTEPSIVDEQKAVALAQRRLAEAVEKIAAVKRNTLRLEKEILLYRGQVQRLETVLSGEVPVAVADLNGLIIALENYAALEPELATSESVASEGTAAAASGDESASMARGSAEAADAAGKTTGAPLESNPASGAIDRRDAWRPSPDERATAEPAGAADVAMLLAGVGAISPKISEDLAGRIGVSRMELSGGRVAMGIGPGGGRGLLIERFVPVAPGDSGWYVGPFGVADNVRAGTIDLADLLAIRPDWATILKLPAGFAVIITDGGIAAVLDSQDRIQWPAPSDL